jgi:hypothetical protein
VLAQASKTKKRWLRLLERVEVGTSQVEALSRPPRRKVHLVLEPLAG